MIKRLYGYYVEMVPLRVVFSMKMKGTALLTAKANTISMN